jgi:hypothetical protein
VFNRWLPQLTLRNDTIFTTERVTDRSRPECYTYRPYLMKVTQKTILNDISTQSMQPANGIIVTKMGSIKYDYLYNDGDVQHYYINSKIGIIRIEFITNGKIRSSQTLNSYYLK